MEETNGRTFGDELVETDGNNFTDCTFNSSVLIYRGGAHPFFDRCTFAGNTSWRFAGPALKTIQFLQRIGQDDGGELFVQALFEKGKVFADDPEPQRST